MEFKSYLEVLIYFWADKDCSALVVQCGLQLQILLVTQFFLLQAGRKPQLNKNN